MLKNVLKEFVVKNELLKQQPLSKKENKGSYQGRNPYQKKEEKLGLEEIVRKEDVYLKGVQFLSKKRDTIFY